MNRSIFWRLVWKEYRTQRAFWLAMVALVFLLQLLVVGLSEGDRGAERLVATTFALALAFSALYAGGCGATLFATEHETGTFEFQRAVPVSSWRLFAAKLTFAVLSTSAILAVLLFLAACISRWSFPAGESAREIWGLFGFGIVELLVWGILFSLVLDQPLKAAILTITTVSVYVHVLAVNYGGLQQDISGYVKVLPLRVAIAAAVGLVNVLVARRWLERSGATAGWSRRAIRTAGQARGGTPALPAQPLEPSRDILFGRLLWQQWRQSRRMMLVVAAAAVPVVCTGVWVSTSLPYYVSGTLEIITLLVSLLAGLMGACVFLGDQWREQFRFFAERGARPGYVWLSRQLVWIAPLVLFTTLVVPPFLFAGREQVLHETYQAQYRLDQFLHESFDSYPHQPSTWLSVAFSSRHVWYFLVCVAVAYAAGQFCSILFRSGILAVVFGLMLGAALCGWTLLMGLLDINSLWAAAPIPLVLLLATRLRTTDWILQRNTLRAWLRLGAVLLVPAVAIVAAVPAARVSGIPEVHPGLLPGEYEREPTAEEQATAAMYQRALEAYRSLTAFLPPLQQQQESEQAKDTAKSAKARAQAEEAWLKANEPTIPLILAAAGRPLGNVACPPRPAYRAWEMPGLGDLADLLVSAARHDQRSGRLDQAMDRYLAALRVVRYMGYYAREWSGRHIELSVYRELQSWSVLPGQTPERIAAMLRQLDTLIPTLPPRCNVLKTQYVLARDLIDLDPDAVQAVRLSPRAVFWIAFSTRWLSWERTRAIRMLDYTMARELAYCRAVDGDRDEWSRLRQMELQGMHGWAWDLSGPSILSEGYLPRLIEYAGQERHWVETQRAVAQLTLGVEAWRLAHGRLPDLLHELVGPYLKELPADPSSHGPFRYFREGFPFAVVAASERSQSDWSTIPAGTPLLASSWLDITLGRSPHGMRWDPIRQRLWRPADAWKAGERIGEDVWFAEPIYPLPPPAKSATAALSHAAESDVATTQVKQ
jgi:hypothetical protein